MVVTVATLGFRPAVERHFDSPKLPSLIGREAEGNYALD
jgi:hypothetical protein